MKKVMPSQGTPPVFRCGRFTLSTYSRSAGIRRWRRAAGITMRTGRRWERLNAESTSGIRNRQR